MRFPPQFLDELRARLPVSEVVGRRVKLRKSGREWKGLSPFNKERTPSFFVNDQKMAWFDFSSGKNGSIFDFVMLTEGLSFPEAVANELTLRRAFGALLDRLLARPERAGRPFRKLGLSARLVGGGSWRRTVTLREATGERGRIRSALGPKLVEIPAPVTELRLEAVELAEHTGQQLALVAPEGEDADLRLREGLRESLPELAPPDRWIWNEVTERFGAVLLGEDLPEAIGWAQDLVGDEPDVYEEFDSLE